MNSTEKKNILLFKSLFGFGPGCDIEFELDKSQTRKSIQVVDHSNNDSKKSKQLIYYDGEDVGGTVIDFIQYVFLYIIRDFSLAKLVI